MSTIVPFHFEGQEVRVVTDASGEPWFPAGAVCAVLGYGNPRQAIDSHVDAEDVQKMDTPTAGGIQQTNHINESGLYALILGSAKDESKRFKRWVTHDVLPTIRKTGVYGSPKASPIASTIEAAKLFPSCFRVARLIGCDKQAAAISANQAVQAVTGTNVLKLLGQAHIAADNQVALYFTPTELGKRSGTSARGMNLLLAEAGLQMKRGDVWEVAEAGGAFARILDTGKRHGSGVPVQQIKWSAEVLPLLGSENAA